MTSIKFTVPSVVVAPGGYIIDCFRVLTSDYYIVLFLSTASIQNKLRLVVEPQGEINGTPVCDIQELFNKLEQSTEEDHQRMAKLLADGLDNPTNEEDDTVPVRYDAVRHDINMKRVPSGMLIKLLKTVSIALDEEVYLTATEARCLRRKYGKRTTSIAKKTNKGFG